MIWIRYGVLGVHVFPQDYISNLSYMSKYLIMRFSENVMVSLCFFCLS